MATSTLNLILHKGLALPPFSLTLRDGPGEAADPLDLTGYSAVASVKASYSEDAPIFDIDLEITDAENGIIQVVFTKAMTSLLTVGNRYYWDLLLTPPGEETYLLFYGKIAVLGVVTPIPS